MDIYPVVKVHIIFQLNQKYFSVYYTCNKSSFNIVCGVNIIIIIFAKKYYLHVVYDLYMRMQYYTNKLHNIQIQ